MYISLSCDQLCVPCVVLKDIKAKVGQVDPSGARNEIFTTAISLAPDRVANDAAIHLT